MCHLPLRQNLHASRVDSKSSAKETGVPLTNSWVTPLCASWPISVVGGTHGSATKKKREPQIWTHSCHWFKKHSNYLKFIQKENQRTTPFLLDILDAISSSTSLDMSKSLEEIKCHPWPPPLATTDQCLIGTRSTTTKQLHRPSSQRDAASQQSPSASW